MEKFGSIEQFKNVIKVVRDRAKWNGTPLPTLKFIGTTKLHGTNASVVFDLKTGNHTFQSREREISIESDNAGFAMWGECHIKSLKEIATNALSISTQKDFSSIVIFGEWCGGSIQKGVALNQLDKMFVIFNITLIDEEGKRTELSPLEIEKAIDNHGEEVKSQIFCIYGFKTWEVDIDFNNPETVQNQLVEWTIEVENECPVGKAFGVSGIGEGIVWWNHETNLKFKTKGSAHSASKVKTLKEIAAVDIEKMNSIKEFVSSVVTENRLNQGLDKLGEMGLDVDIKNTGPFIKWVVGDVMREEKDTIVASGFDVKEIMPKVSDVAKNFFLGKVR